MKSNNFSPAEIEAVFGGLHIHNKINYFKRQIPMYFMHHKVIFRVITLEEAVFAFLRMCNGHRLIKLGEFLHSISIVFDLKIN